MALAALRPRCSIMVTEVASSGHVDWFVCIICFYVIATDKDAIKVGNARLYIISR